jgi:hypothetical protein
MYTGDTGHGQEVTDWGAYLTVRLGRRYQRLVIKKRNRLYTEVSDYSHHGAFGATGEVAVGMGPCCFE